MILRIGKKKKEFALTLIELLIVLAIMALFFGISIPLFSKFAEGAKLEGAARSIASTLATARGYAITKNANYYVFFDPATSPHSYFISTADNGSVVIEKVHRLPIGLWFYDPGGGSAINFTKGTHASAKAALFTATGELDETSNNTSVYVADGQTASAKSKEVTVERTTGRVRIN